MYAKTLIKNPFFWGVLIGIASIHLYRELAYMRRHAPPPIAQITPWEFPKVPEGSFSSNDLKGSIAIANVIDLSSPQSKIDTKKSLMEVAKRFKKREGIQFLSFVIGEDEEAKRLMGSDFWPTNFPKHSYLKVTQSDLKKLEMDYPSQLFLIDEEGNLRAYAGLEGRDLAALVSAAEFLIDKRRL